MLCSLYGNKIGPAGAAALAPGLATNASLTKILVGQNQLRDEGTTMLCDALRESKVTQVQELDLTLNSIGPEGAKAVASMAAVVPSLTGKPPPDRRPPAPPGLTRPHQQFTA